MATIRLDALLERDAACADPKAPVKITRRHIDGHEVYFAINDSAAAWSGEIRFCGSGVDEQWDPATGAVAPLADGTKVAARLGPYGALLFRAARGSVPRRVGGDASAGLRMAVEPLPTAKVTAGCGQHVRSALSGDDASGWAASATLTKGQVDTHLFVSFSYAQPLSLSESAGLVIDSSVPEGQRTPAELLVFIATRDGGSYIASTGRHLSVAGAACAHVLFSQFKPFGTTHGALDLSQVAAVRVGWGGYFGAEGERIAVTVKPPQRFVCGPK